MTESRQNTVVAGVDGSEPSTAAALWAAAEAERRAATLHLVHSYVTPVSGFVGPSVMPPYLTDVSRELAKQILAETAAKVESVFPALRVSTEIRHDPPVVALREVSRHALLTVVGSVGAHRFPGGLLGSVAARLAAHAVGPVVVVGADRQANQGADERAGQGADRQAGQSADQPAGIGPIVVGLDGSSDSEDALAFAFEEASFRSSMLIAVHSWDDSALDGYLRAYPLEADRSQVDEEERRVLAEQLAGWSGKYPDVRVQEVVLRGRPAAALLGYCRRIATSTPPALLVVGGRGLGGFTGMLLGSTGHALIGHADQPVAIVRGRHGH